MNFTLTVACSSCPFRRTGFIPLRPGRVREIASSALKPDGATFSCHKTVEHDDDGEHVRRDDEEHCAGFLIFAEKHDNATQMMRIAERIRSYDRTKLQDQDGIFDTLTEMLRAHARANRRLDA